MKMTKLRRNAKALSPIFATLILIAIAVIAGVVVYAFTSGFLSAQTTGGTAGTEKVTIQSATFSSNSSGGYVTVLYQSTSGPLPTINGMLLKNAAGNTVDSLNVGTSGLTPWSTGALTTVTGTNTTLLSSGAYTVVLITKAGGSFVSPAFTVP